MDEKIQQLTHWISHEQVKQICTEICTGTAYGVNGFVSDLETFEPFLQAEKVFFKESPVLSIASAPAWMEQTVEELAAEAGGEVTSYVLLCGFSENNGSLLRVQEIGDAMYDGIDQGDPDMMLTYNIMDWLKEEETVVVLLAAVNPKPKY